MYTLLLFLSRLCTEYVCTTYYLIDQRGWMRFETCNSWMLLIYFDVICANAKNISKMKQMGNSVVICNSNWTRKSDLKSLMMSVIHICTRSTVYSHLYRTVHL
jgi:hypothetical protein